MSEQTRSYMQLLDDWTNNEIIVPLVRVLSEEQEDPLETDRHQSEVFAQVEKAIRSKVLESYRNGQAAGPYKRPAHPQKQTAK